MRHGKRRGAATADPLDTTQQQPPTLFALSGAPLTILLCSLFFLLGQLRYSSSGGTSATIFQHGAPPPPGVAALLPTQDSNAGNELIMGAHPSFSPKHEGCPPLASAPVPPPRASEEDAAWRSRVEHAAWASIDPASPQLCINAQRGIVPAPDAPFGFCSQNTAGFSNPMGPWQTLISDLMAVNCTYSATPSQQRLTATLPSRNASVYIVYVMSAPFVADKLLPPPYESFGSHAVRLALINSTLNRLRQQFGDALELTVVQLDDAHIDPARDFGVGVINTLLSATWREGQDWAGYQDGLHVAWDRLDAFEWVLVLNDQMVGPVAHLPDTLALATSAGAAMWATSAMPGGVAVRGFAVGYSRALVNASSWRLYWERIAFPCAKMGPMMMGESLTMHPQLQWHHLFGGCAASAAAAIGKGFSLERQKAEAPNSAFLYRWGIENKFFPELGRLSTKASVAPGLAAALQWLENTHIDAVIEDCRLDKTGPHLASASRPYLQPNALQPLEAPPSSSPLPPPPASPPSLAPLAARLARPRISAWQRANLRVTVETHPWPTGGPEGLAQLLKALADWGVPLPQLFATEDVNSVFGRYTEGMPIWSGEHRRGDILVTSEYAPCPLPPQSGVRQIGYLLGTGRGRPMQESGAPVFEDQAHCAWIGHSHYTRGFAFAPTRSIVRQWYNGEFSDGAATDAKAASAQKRDVVVVDGDYKDAVPPLLSALATSHPNAAVTVLEGFSRAGVRDLFASAKVIVDGNMMGMEHANAEATMQWVVPVMQRWRAGGDVVDYPHDDALRFDTLEQMVETVRQVLNSYEQYAAVAAGTNRAWHLLQREVQLTDVARFFDSAGLSVHILACSGSEGGSVEGSAATLEQRERAALLVAAAVYLAAPLASVTVHVEGAAGVTALLAEAKAGRGLFIHASVLFSSPLCKGKGGVINGALAAHQPFGRPEHIALLSWRALPVAPAALSAWTATTRDSAGLVMCACSPLHTADGIFGLLLDAAGGREPGDESLVLLQDGTFRREAQLMSKPSAACEGFISGSDSTEGPVVTDALLLLQDVPLPVDTDCALLGDEVVLDVVGVLEGAGLPVPAAISSAANTCARSGAPLAVTRLLCANEMFVSLAQRLGVSQACPSSP